MEKNNQIFKMEKPLPQLLWTENENWKDEEATMWVSIPFLNILKATDPFARQSKAVHTIEVVAEGIPRLTKALPGHLKCVKSFVDPQIQFLDIRELPDFYPITLHVTDVERRRVVQGSSNKTTIFQVDDPFMKLNICVESTILYEEGQIIHEMCVAPETAKVEEEKDNGMQSGGSSSSAPKLCPATTCPPMKILHWNVRGARNASFRRNFIALDAAHSPDVVILTETRTSGDDARRIMNSLGFDGVAKVDAISYVGGIWLMWKGDKVSLVSSTDQSIHAIIEVKIQ